MDKRQELIKQCRYYKGESEPPRELINAGTHFIWLCEELWYKHQMGGEAPRLYCSKYLKSDKLPSSFFTREDIPHALLVLLYDRYCYYNALPVNLSPEALYTKGITEFYENFISKHYPLL